MERYAIKRRRILYLIFATFTLLITGLIYAWSLFAKPLGAEFPEYSRYLGQVFQVSMIMFCVSALVGAQIVRKIRVEAAIIIAAILLGAGFALTARLAHTGVVALFICYGVLAASGVGIAYNAIISAVVPWFPDRVGLASGILMMGFGLASLVFGSLANKLFMVWAPDAAAGLLGWRPAFYLVGAIGAVILLLLAIALTQPPLNIVFELTGEEPAKTDGGEEKRSHTKEQNILTTRIYWLAVVWFVIISACGLTLIMSARQGADALNVSFGALLVGLVSTMNGIGRIVSGAIIDKKGVVFVMSICAVVMIMAMAGLMLSFKGDGSKMLYVIMAIAVAFPYGGCPVLNSAIARQRYGVSDYAKNLSCLNLVIAGAAVLNIVILSIVGPLQGEASAIIEHGRSIYTILFVLALIALGVTFIFAKAYKTDLKQIEQELKVTSQELK